MLNPRKADNPPIKKVKKRFGFNIFILITSSVFLFLYNLALVISPFITIPDIPKWFVYVVIMTGYLVGLLLMYFSIRTLWKMIAKPVLLEKIAPINPAEFNHLMDRIKDTNIGPKLMNHVMECESCKQKSFELNSQATKHIEETDKLI